MHSFRSSNETGDGGLDMVEAAALGATVQGVLVHRVVLVAPEEVAISTFMIRGTHQTTDGSRFRKTSSGVSRLMVMATLSMVMVGTRTVEHTGRLPGKACKSRSSVFDGFG